MAEFIKPDDLSKPWASTGEKNEPSDTKKANGWGLEIPTYQDFNWILNRADSFNAHVNQSGIPEWDSVTEYRINSYSKGSNGDVYKSKTINSNQDPVGDGGTNWIKVLSNESEILPTVNITPTSSWLSTGGGYFRAKISGGSLILNIKLNGGTVTSSTVIGNLPTNYLPTYNQELPAFYEDGLDLKTFLIILTAGQPEIRLGETLTSNQTIHCNATVLQ